MSEMTGTEHQDRRAPCSPPPPRNTRSVFLHVSLKRHPVAISHWESHQYEPAVRVSVNEACSLGIPILGHGEVKLELSGLTITQTRTTPLANAPSRGRRAGESHCQTSGQNPQLVAGYVQGVGSSVGGGAVQPHQLTTTPYQGEFDEAVVIDDMSSNHVNGLNGVSAEPCGFQWNVGLLNAQYKYLTAEAFGFKVNANGTALKKKQMWTLEPYGEEDAVSLRSHLDKYLAVDQFGNVTCDSDEKEAGAKFYIAVADDGSGRWALRNAVRGYFLGASNDKLTCTAKAPGKPELWTVHLAARPQVNFRSVGRRRYARLSSSMDEIQVDANTPWGEDTLFTLEFQDGKYAVHTCNNRYLQGDGKLLEQCSPECLFSLEYHGGFLALRDIHGRYVAPIGSKAVLRTRSQSVTKDELFSLEDSLPQAAFVGFNGKYVSVKQGIDVTANQDEISDHETFQLEFDKATKRWYIRTMQDKYWTLESSAGIQANADKGSSNSLFDLVWQSDGSVAFIANNGKYVAAKKSGHLFANSDKIEDMEKFYFYLVNRAVLVLKCEQGFVGFKSVSSHKLECNKATYETISVERDEKGICFFKGGNDKYWSVAEDGTITVNNENRQGFYIELREPSKLCIKTTHGSYVIAEKNGVFRVNGLDPASATQWEY